MNILTNCNGLFGSGIVLGFIISWTSFYCYKRKKTSYSNSEEVGWDELDSNSDVSL